MRVLQRFWLVGLVGTLVVACEAREGEQEGAVTETAEPAERAVDPAAEAQSIRDKSMAWLQAAKARDAATTSAFFAADGEMLEEGGPPHVGPDAIRADTEADWAEVPDATIDWTISNVVVAESGDLAYERGHWTFDPDGDGEAPAEEGEYLTVWKKVGGEWKAAADMGVTTSSTEAMEEETPQS